MQRKIIVSAFLSVSVIFLLTASLFAFPSFGAGSAAAPTRIINSNVVAGYQATSGLRSVSYVAGSYRMIFYGCFTGSHPPCNLNPSVSIGIDVNLEHPLTSGIQVGVIMGGCPKLSCEYRPYFVYGGAIHIFAPLAYPTRYFCGFHDCNVFMSIQYFSDTKTMLLYFYDVETGRVIHQTIDFAGSYSRNSVDWFIYCPNACASAPDVEFLFSGGVRYTGFPQADYATVSGKYLPVKELSNRTVIEGFAGTPVFLSPSSWALQGVP